MRVEGRSRCWGCNIDDLTKGMRQSCTRREYSFELLSMHKALESRIQGLYAHDMSILLELGFFQHLLNLGLLPSVRPLFLVFPVLLLPFVFLVLLLVPLPLFAVTSACMHAIERAAKQVHGRV